MEVAEARRLRQEIERSLNGAFDPADVLPRLARLVRVAPAESDDGVFAHLKLAELIAAQDPWRAALFARRALAHDPNSDRGWATLALCQTLLQNYRFACTAYRQAIARAPSNPWYAHNLGHLLDVALGQSKEALRWLRSAHQAKPESTEIIASYVHALARSGDLTEARRVLDTGRKTIELNALGRWLDQGAPAPPTKTKNKRRSVTQATRLAEVLEQGLAHLPLDSRQREAALALAHDALPPRRKRKTQTLATLAAAAAYAIVYIDHVPLSHAEVAAPFRVGVAHLRGRFAELRAQLDILPGDARYGSRA